MSFIEQAPRFQKPTRMPQPTRFQQEPVEQSTNSVGTYINGVRYTADETVNTKYTVQDAVAAAGTIFKDRVKIKPAELNLKSIETLNRGSKITIIEVNRLTGLILADSFVFDKPRSARIEN
jgi:hypothetical protein